MRVAVLADIHGNILALDAVLADLASRDADIIVNLGDCVSGPLWPRETMDRLQKLNIPTVRGNCDRDLAGVAPEMMDASDRFAWEQLGPKECAYLGALPTTLNVAPGVLACHSTPSDDDLYLIDEVESGHVVRSRPDAIAKRLGAVDAKIVLCGHSHRPDLVQLPGGPIVLNPGSVGCPAYDAGDPPFVSESGSPHARYAIVELKPDGRAAFELRAVPYAHEEAARRAEANGRPEWAFGLRQGLHAGTEMI
jgi:predicted phosphodiesterase